MLEVSGDRTCWWVASPGPMRERTRHINEREALRSVERKALRSVERKALSVVEVLLHVLGLVHDAAVRLRGLDLGLELLRKKRYILGNI